MNQLVSLTPREAAQAASMGVTKFYQLLNSGALPARKCGRSTLILRTDLEAYLASLPAYQPKRTAEA